MVKVEGGECHPLFLKTDVNEVFRQYHRIYANGV